MTKRTARSRPYREMQAISFGLIILLLMAVMAVLRREVARNAAPSSVTVELFYYNEIEDGKISKNLPASPAAVLPVRREVPKGGNIIAKTIELLLEGKLTDQERSQGFRTEFPNPGFRLIEADLRDGTLTLRFEDKNNFTVGGSSRVTLLRAGIEKTAKQFPGVKQVITRPEELFQP